MAYELEDVWINALAKLPNAKPLAELLRSETPMPPGARDLLAEYLHPEKPEIAGGRLVYEKRLGALEKVLSLRGRPRSYSPPDKLRYRGWLAVASDYYRLKKDADAVARLHNMDRRTVFRYLEAWKNFVARLRGSDRNPG